MANQNLNRGKIGEEIAADLLRKNGYKILTRNYRTKLGEIDIVAYDKGTVCFIEVKSRRSDKFGFPQEAIANHKQRQISKAALMFLKEKNLLGRRARFDVVSVLYSDDTPKLELIKDAFELGGGFTY